MPDPLTESQNQIKKQNGAVREMYRILLVEDDKNIQNLISNYFTKKEKENFSVDIASDGQTGLEKAYENNYDIYGEATVNLFSPSNYIHKFRQLIRYVLLIILANIYKKFDITLIL